VLLKHEAGVPRISGFANFADLLQPKVRLRILAALGEVRVFLALGEQGRFMHADRGRGEPICPALTEDSRHSFPPLGRIFGRAPQGWIEVLVGHYAYRAGLPVLGGRAAADPLADRFAA
jgi:hypothetical protein